MDRPVSVLDDTLVRQSPITLIVALAGVLSFAVPAIPVTNVVALIWSFVVTALATVVAVFASRRPDNIPLTALVPAIDFIAVALLRTGTGAAASAFTSLVVLPVVWMGSTEGRRHIVYAVLGSVLVILAPLALEPGSGLSASELTRLGISMAVFLTVAFVVHVLAFQYRTGMRTAREDEGRVREEIDRAAAVQRSLLPSSSTTVGDGVSVAGTCLPAKTVGGDFFDWYPTATGMALTLGDVMGKGVGAGLIASAVRASVRSAHAVDDPAEALRRASDGLAAGTDSDDVSFTTLFHARLSSEGVLRWADAGHGLSAIVRSEGAVERLVSRDLPLGLPLGDEWQTNTTWLEPGELLISVSDGVLDLFDGARATIDGIAAYARIDPDPAAIVALLSARAEEIPHEDDVTIVVVRREPVAVSRNPVVRAAGGAA